MGKPRRYLCEAAEKASESHTLGDCEARGDALSGGVGPGELGGPTRLWRSFRIGKVDSIFERAKERERAGI